MFKKLLKFVDCFFVNFFVLFIKIYQFTFSPDKGFFSPILKWRICRHTPHCSEYCLQVLKRYWFIKWYIYSMDRIIWCTPWNSKKYDPPYFKVIFFSSALIGVEFLEKLIKDNRFEIVWVVTSPDKPSGRWMKIQENIIKQKAKEFWIREIKTPQSFKPDKNSEWKDFCERVKILDPDFFVVISYWKILPADVLNLPQIAPINLHWSLLPKYRGASPLQTVFLEEEKETWITVMKMISQMDAGDIIKKIKFELPFERTSKDLLEKIRKVWPEFLNQVLWDFGKGNLNSFSQNEKKASYCQKINKEDGEINLYKDSLGNVYSKYRAYYLWPWIFFVMDQKFLKNKWKTVKIEKLIVDYNEFQNYKEQPLLFDDKFSLNPAVKEILVKPAWKKQISWENFVKWYLK